MVGRGHVTGRGALKRLSHSTPAGQPLTQVRPDGPVDRVGVFLGILVEDPSREMVEHGFFQCHAVHLAGAELLEIAADVRHALIGRLGSGLERIVVADVDGLALDLPAVDLEHLVFQDGRVVVELSLEDRPFGDLDESRRDLDAAPLRELAIRAFRPVSLARTTGCDQAGSEQEGTYNGPAGCASTWALRLENGGNRR